MRSVTALLTLGLMLGAASPALSAATPEGAGRLTAFFQSYLGDVPGVVSVTRQGESYAARINLGPLFARVKDPAVTLALSPLEWTITEQGGGKWKVDQSQPLTFAFGVKGEGKTRGSIASVVSTGIFDEALGGFASASAELKTIAADQTVTDEEPPTVVSYAIDTMTMQTTMQGTPDAADATSSYGFTGMKQTIKMAAAADNSTPAMDLVVTAPSGRQDGTVKGLRLRAISDLATWLVAHQDRSAFIAAQAEFKDRLRAALPLFTSLSGSSSLDDLTIASPFGQFAVKQFGIGAEMNGVVANGRLRETFSFAGLQIPSSLLPSWAAGLVPKDFNVDVSVADFDLAAPAAMILDKLDLSKPEPLPKDMEQPLLQALLPNGSVTIALGPSQLLASLYDLKAQGSMTAGPAAMPAGQALVTLKGLEETMAALQAGPPDIQQIAPVLLLAKGLGKTEADGSLSWKIEATAAGTITVNGADVTKMLSGQ